MGKYHTSITHKSWQLKERTNLFKWITQTNQPTNCSVIRSSDSLSFYCVLTLVRWLSFVHLSLSFTPHPLPSQKLMSDWLTDLSINHLQMTLGARSMRSRFIQQITGHRNMPVALSQLFKGVAEWLNEPASTVETCIKPIGENTSV